EQTNRRARPRQVKRKTLEVTLSPRQGCARRSDTLPSVAAPSPSRSPQPLPPPSDRDDDLSALLVRLQVAVRPNDLVKRERPGDEGLEAAVCEPGVDELLRPVEARRVARDLQHHVAADRGPLSQNVEQGQGRRLRAENLGAAARYRGRVHRVR